MLRILVACLMLTLGLGEARAFEAKEVKSKRGLTAWLVEDHSNPMLAINFAFDGGSAADTVGKEGTAFLLSALMDEGAGELSGEQFQARRDDHVIRLSFNVRTDKFYGNLQTLTHNKQVAFDLLKLALSQPTLPSEAIERMRQQAIVSAQAALQNPSSIGFRSMADLYFNNHPFAHPAGGTPDSLVRISRDDIVALRKQLFTRAGLKISAVGDISPDELAVELDDAFGSLPDTPAPAALPAVKVTDGPQVKIIERDIPQTVLLFGGAGIAQNDPDFFAAYVMSSILGGDATSSWLNKEVREKAGLTYSIDYSLMPFENGGLYLGSFSTVNENAGVALQKVRETLNRMLKDGPSQKELDDTKTFLTGSYALRYDTNEKIAGNLLSQQILGRPIDFVKKRNSLIDAVTLAQVQAQAKRLLAPDKLLVVAVGKPVMMQ